MEKLGTLEEVKNEYQRLGRTEPLKDGAGPSSRNLQVPAENRSTNFTKNLTSQRYSDLTGSVETSSPSRFVPSPLPELALHGAKADHQDHRLEIMIHVPPSVLEGAGRASPPLEPSSSGGFVKAQAPCLLHVSNSVISGDLLVQSLGKHAFGVQLPSSIEGLFKIGLLSVAGRQPPQVQWALNAKSGSLQGRELKELRASRKVHGRATRRGLELEESNFLGAVDY
jgi:hypothetical protein